MLTEASPKIIKNFKIHWKRLKEVTQRDPSGKP